MLFDLDFCSISCGNLSLSVASSSFRSHFVENYVIGVQWRIWPHGQAANGMCMERVPMVQPNHSQTTMVKDSQSSGQPKSFAVARLCFYHVNICVASSSISEGVLTPVDQSVNRIEQPPLHGFICHDYHTARSQVVEIYVSVWQRRI